MHKKLTMIIKKNKERYLKLGYNHNLAEKIENLIIKKKYSPYAALEKIKEIMEVNFCLKTLYKLHT